jgi:hypothetical protein
MGAQAGKNALVGRFMFSFIEHHDNLGTSRLGRKLVATDVNLMVNNGGFNFDGNHDARQPRSIAKLMKEAGL